MRRIAFALALFFGAFHAGAQRPLLLVPQPREAAAERDVTLAHGLEVVLPPDSADAFAARDLRDALKDAGVPITRTGAGSARIVFLRAGGSAARALLARHRVAFDSAMSAEGYVLVPEGRTLTVIGATPAGVFYGAQTVKQLVEGNGPGAVLRMATVRDWPAMRHRGLHDDLSRGPVPTLDFMKKQIRIFAAYKLNTYSPYFEHTLEYRANPLIAPPGGAITRDDVKELVAYAQRYHIDVIPEQEAFGHLHHALKYELYAPLAETPHGHVLAPGQPGSMALIKQWFAEIDTLFPSKYVHLGADETFELGRGQTADRVTAEGIGPVYLGFLRDIVNAIAVPGKKYLFWGDFAVRSPDLVKSLPKQMVAVPWSYGTAASYDRQITPFTNAGLETWVAPGVSSWSRVYPNFNTAFVNIRNFVRDGQRLGATGMLNTTWDDDGETLFEQTWMGVLFGAAASWQPGESDIAAFERAYGPAFYRDTTGRANSAERLMMQAHAILANAGLGNGSDALFWQDPFSADGQITAEKIRPVAHDLRIAAESAMVYVAQLRNAGPVVNEDALAALELGARRMDFIGMKFQFADDIRAAYARAADTTLKNGTRDLGDVSGTNGRMQDLRDGYGLTRELYQAAWLRENRPYWLQNVLAKYDMAMHLWIARAERFAAARSEMARTKKLPGFEAVGIPAPLPASSAPAATPSPGRR
ncbi:MAG TPA: beta-N-acetylhexosaminidase [Gemmatimonadaceae bacterium]|nr:beta-N-acetylhexosaminidase [Gemmatimonadaceae bacterium]